MSIFYFRLACDQTRRTWQAYARPKRRGILFPLPYATPETLAEWQPQWLGSKVFQCHTLCSGSNNGRDLPILDLLKRKEDLGSIENLHEGSTAGRDRTAEQGQSRRICVLRKSIPKRFGCENCDNSIPYRYLYSDCVNFSPKCIICTNINVQLKKLVYC